MQNCHYIILRTYYSISGLETNSNNTVLGKWAV